MCQASRLKCWSAYIATGRNPTFSGKLVEGSETTHHKQFRIRIWERNHQLADVNRPKFDENWPGSCPPW